MERWTNNPHNQLPEEVDLTESQNKAGTEEQQFLFSQLANKIRLGLPMSEAWQKKIQTTQFEFKPKSKP